MDRVGEYLASLPGGLRALPEAQVRREIVDDQLEWHARVGHEVDPRLAPYANDSQSGWASEVLANALVLSVREAYPTETAFLSAIYERQRALFQTPFYRAVMLVMSPTLVTMGADRRWATFRRGSQLEMGRWKRDGTSRASTATLVHPPGLHPEPILKGFGEMFRAAVDGAGAKQSTIVLAERGDTSARWELAYRG